MTYVNPVGARTGYHSVRGQSERFGRRLRNIDVAAAVVTFWDLRLCGAASHVVKGETRAMTRNGILAIAVAAFCALGVASAEAADLKKGKKVFNKCKACHALEAGKKKVGPSLHGVFGRKAGTVDGFKYSKAMKESGVVWSPETLTEYLKKPKDFIPGTKMVFAGIKKDKQIVDLIAYLEESTKKE